jgi:hypothetical protein
MLLRLLSRHEHDGEDMTIEYFSSLIKKNSTILYPACLVQTKLRTTICGMKFWLNIEKIRENMFGEDYVPLAVILKHEGKRELIDKEMEEKRQKQEKM